MIVAITISALLITGAIVLDFGLARLERTTNKSAADNAVAAGLRAGDGGTGEFYNYRGVCEALRYLRANRTSLGGLPDDVCASENSATTCTPGDPAVSYNGTTAYGGRRYQVWIKSPYSLGDTTMGGPFPEESTVGTLSTDPSDSTQSGCDQIGVVIKEWTSPGLGKIVNSNEIVTRTRSVGRVKVSNGDVPPALLLLERTNCGVLTVGSGGSPSRIQVAGSGVTPATIHTDSTATGAGCGSGSNQQLIQGKQADGVVAYGGSGGAAGSITSVATKNGVASNVVVDDPFNAYATTSTWPTNGSPVAISGRTPVTRSPIDKRYLAGVTAAAMSASSQWSKSHSSPSGYTRYGCPTNADMITMAGLTAADSVYIDCGGNSGISLTGTIGAGNIFFHGFIKGGVLAMPNARRVYVDNTDDNMTSATNGSAITLNNNTAFCVRATAANCNTASPATGQCSSSPTSVATSQARLFIRRGMLNGAGGNSLLRLCNTTVIMEGGDVGANTSTNPGACLPGSWGIAPTSTPCTSATATVSTGNSQINTSGVADWTAPNYVGDMTAAGLTKAQKQALWDGGEDLALWTESYGGASSPTFAMSGGGNMHVAGVFMAPNAAPFSITGGGAQDLTNAQYVVTSFAVGGGATLKMSVDPNNAVALPSLTNFSLVR